MSANKPAGSTSATNRRAQLRAEAEAAAKRARQKKIIVTAVSVVAVAALLIAGLVWAQNRERPTASDSLPVNATAAGNGHLVADAGDDVPLVEMFFDYQCPACASLEMSAGEEILAGGQAGEYELVYRPMIFLDTNLRNDASLRATNAAACYAEVGDYAEYHQAVFANQPTGEGTGYSDALLRDQLPAQLGTGGEQLEAFQTCYDEGRYESFADRSNTEAARDGVTGTPTLRVDGEDLDRSAIASAPELRAALAAAGQ